MIGSRSLFLKVKLFYISGQIEHLSFGALRRV